MSKNNITQYPDSELSLIVFNDEYLYTHRHSRHLKHVLDEMFIYTPEQWAELQEDLSDDCDEEC
jgi:hypothetical protein